MGKAREGARRAQCANNLRQHGVAWYLYLDDHNECFPKAGLPGNELDPYVFGGKAGGFVGATHYDTYTANMRPLNCYLDVDNTSSAEIFHCPDDTKVFLDYKTSFNKYGTSYCFNGAICIFGAGPNHIPRPLSTITNPQSKVWMEMCIPFNNPGHGGKGITATYPNTPVMVLFVDGHVKGPYLYYSEFDDSPTDPDPKQPVYERPNTTED